MRLFITGANGFIGTHLTEGILSGSDWTISAFDVCDENVSSYRRNPRYHFRRGDIFTDDEYLRAEIRESDVVLSLAGIAKPAYYLKKPLWTFELDFEQNLKIVRMCADEAKRLVFPSTSEVYGMSQDEELLEDESPLITGPVTKQRWIYSCAKQMMDRVVVAYGVERGLDYTLFRPFNWIGPRLDSFRDAAERTARSVTQMIYDVLYRGTISLVGGGTNKRSFLWIGDAVEALITVIADERGRASRQIFNIGNPAGNASIRELAETILHVMREFPSMREAAKRTKLEVIEPEAYYQEGYEDMKNRVPCIRKIETLLGWAPRTSLEEAIRRTLRYYEERGVYLDGAKSPSRGEPSSRREGGCVR